LQDWLQIDCVRFGEPTADHTGALAFRNIRIRELK
jgi:hypothetical protein